LDPILEREFRVIPTVKRPQQIISIFIADSTSIDLKDSSSYPAIMEENKVISSWKEVCFLGVGNPRDNLNEWSGGEVRLAKEADQKSRAEHKLLEAFEIFPVSIKKGSKALDLGSSPGGWTRILHQMGFEVTSVDRAPLDKDVSSLKGVKFIQKDALHFRDKINTYDVLTNDMNQDPCQSAKAVISSSESLKQGGNLIWTIKLPGNSPEKIIEKSIKMISPYFDIKCLRQLYHNRDEVTLWGLKK
jgi:23S rRNA (cytidine2498-2'-O)-methyltransferase